VPNAGERSSKLSVFLCFFNADCSCFYVDAISKHADAKNLSETLNILAGVLSILAWFDLSVSAEKNTLLMCVYENTRERNCKGIEEGKAFRHI